MNFLQRLFGWSDDDSGVAQFYRALREVEASSVALEDKLEPTDPEREQSERDVADVLLAARNSRERWT
jgi:hypothetical protein